MSAVRLIEVSKSFEGEVAAVDRLSLTAPEGRMLVVLGPSGCGKTTLLRLVAGLEKPQSGRVLIGGREVAGPRTWIPAEKRRVGLVFQDFALFPHLTVLENVKFGLSRHCAERSHERARELLERLSLSQLEMRYPDQLSGGQQQRVALARALAPEPEVLLMDEPFNSLDAELRNQMRIEVKELLGELGTTSILVTHDQEEALLMGHRLAVLRAGRLLQEGKPEVVFAHPTSRFVASFLGKAEFVPATTRSYGFDTELGPVRQITSLPPDSSVVLLVRPDDIRVTAEPGGSATVLSSEYQGMLILYTLQLTSGRTVRSLANHSSRLKAGAKVRVELLPGHDLHYFQGDSNEAVKAEGTFIP